MVAAILKDHLNTNACVSVIVRAKRAERCLCVCGGGGMVVGVVCMVAPILKDHLNQCMCQCHCELKVSACQSLATNHGDVSMLFEVTSFQHEICSPKT